MRFDILTIFPEIFDSYLNESIIKRARKERIIDVYTHDIRKFSLDKHKKVDDKPFGGGPGMLMTPQPLHDAIAHVRKFNKGPVIFLTPDGKQFTQRTAEKFVKRLIKDSKKDKPGKPQAGIILLCGRYEGIDQRIRDHFVDMELTVGKYVLTGGELPAMIIVDAVSRLIPGVLGDDESSQEETFSKILKGKKEYPQYTRPASFMGHQVPDILLSGHHKDIQDWKMRKIR